MKPKAIRNIAMVRGTDGLLRLEMADAGRKVVLDSLAELVWDLSDGSRSLEDLTQAAGRTFDRMVPKEEVFSALDFLADAGLIEERVAPPMAETNVSRRSLLVRMAPVVGPAAWMMSGTSARADGFFQAGESNKAIEQSTKERMEEKTKAENRERDDKLENDIDETAKRFRIGNQRQGRIEKDPGRVVAGKYKVAPNDPLVGKWTSVKYYDWAREFLATGRCNDTCVEFTLVWTISSSGILEAHQSFRSYIWEAQVNWKYTSAGSHTGVMDHFQVLEELKGETLRWRGDIRWIRSGEFEYTTTFAPQRELIGRRYRFVRDRYWRESIR